MESNHIFQKGREVAKFYYGAQRYFGRLILLLEGVANLLVELGWEVPILQYGRRVSVQHASWTESAAPQLPKFYKVMFSKRISSGDQTTDQYRFYLWFFQNDPLGEQGWVPTGFFYRVTLKEGGQWDEWNGTSKIAEAIRNYCFIPRLESTFIQLTSPFPFALADVENQLQALNVVPFPLASIVTSEDLEYITKKAVKALSELTPDTVRRDPEYLKRVWSL